MRRDHLFSTDQFYHIYNRGVEKRPIFIDEGDVSRFFVSIQDFNDEGLTGSIYENFYVKKQAKTLGHQVSKSPLVKFISYAVNHNHYHFLLQPVIDKGIEHFMHRLDMGYSKYFNAKYKRKGTLWESKFQSKIIDSNGYLLHLSVYINLNHQAHGLGHQVSKLARTSWGEYLGDNSGTICDKSIILSQFNSPREYCEFAEASLQDIIETKLAGRELFE